MRGKYGKTLIACYMGFITQAISANFAPLLYITFSQTYALSLTKLALISTCFFITQLVVDFICAKYVDRIGYRVCILASEILSGAGLIGLAVLPEIMPPYTGIIVSVIVYAVGSGLIEVLVSPIVEACPFENKEGTMSLLHSFYCWGSVGVILGSTLFFALFGIENWKILAVIWAIVPFVNVYNFAVCPIEKPVQDGEGMTMGGLFRTKLFWLLLVLMVCAGACEISMSQWVSAFTESALHISKTVGDIAGPCGFAVCMGISRVWYGKYSEKVDLKKFMLVSGTACLVCYLTAALAGLPIMGLIACALCGFTVGIMWPGSISISSAALPKGGTAMFALLALAGDMGGSIGPALVGGVSQSAAGNMQAGLLASSVFPLILVVSVMAIIRRERKCSGQ